MPRSGAACLRRLSAFPPMPALQSFSLPRSGSRVTASPCPPVVQRQRRCDFEALFRSGIRCDKRSVAEPHRPMLSWASQLGAPPERASRSIRERTGRSHQGSARTRTDPVASPHDRCHRRPKATTTPNARGRNDRVDITVAPRCQGDCDRLCHRRSGVLTGLRPRRRRRHGPAPRRPARSSEAVGTTHPRARAPHVIPSCPWSLPAAWIRPPKRATPSAPPRSVRSAAAVEGVHVADGLIGSRSVAQGWAIGAMTPASARRRDVPSYVSTTRVRSVARAALLRRAAVPNVGV